MADGTRLMRGGLAFVLFFISLRTFMEPHFAGGLWKAFLEDPCHSFVTVGPTPFDPFLQRGNLGGGIPKEGFRLDHPDAATAIVIVIADGVVQVHIDDNGKVDGFVLLVHGARIYVQSRPVVGHPISLVDVPKDVNFGLDAGLNGPKEVVASRPRRGLPVSPMQSCQISPAQGRPVGNEKVDGHILPIVRVASSTACGS